MSIAKYLPFLSGIYYDKEQSKKLFRERDSETKRGLKEIGHIFYGIASVVLVAGAIIYSCTDFNEIPKELPQSTPSSLENKIK